MTGYQRGNLSLSEIKDSILDIINSDDKYFYYLKHQLRSAKDIYMKGGHVTSVYSDQIYRLMYDNKRLIQDSVNSDLYDSRPLKDVDEGMLIRYISKLPKTIMYSKNVNSVRCRYKSKGELIVRNFIKALLMNELNLNKDSFKSYKEIVDYIKEFNKEFNISENYISQLKRRGNYVKIPRTDEGILFVDYVRIRFPDFEGNKLFIT